MYLIVTETGSKHASSSFEKQTPRHKCTGCGSTPFQCGSSSNIGHAPSGGQLTVLLLSCVHSGNCLKS